MFASPGAGPRRAAARGACLACAACVVLAGCRGHPSPVDGPVEADIRAVQPGLDTGPAARPTAPRAAATWTLPPGAERRAGAPIPALATPTPAPAAPIPDTGPPLTDPAIVALLAGVDPSRLQADVERLAGFGTRHSLSATGDPDRGIGAAREWLFKAFDGMNGPGVQQVQVVFEDVDTAIAGSRSTQRNVVATLPGTGKPKRFVYGVAHYDDAAIDADGSEAPAPGANDNASGVAVLLEAARLLSRQQWPAGIRLVGFAAGEQEQKGSSTHARGAKGVQLPLRAVLDIDTVGTPLDGAAGGLAVYPPPAGRDEGTALARYLAAMADRYGGPPVALEDPQGGADSDHAPFGKNGFAAVRLSGAPSPDAGTAADTATEVSPDALAAAARLVVATLASLASAPPAVADAPSVHRTASGLEVSWEPVEGVAGYWVVQRGADEDRYHGATWVGAGTSTVLAPPPGEVYVAVAAADAQGHMSLFSKEAHARP